MPKMKTSKSAAKRIMNITRTGKMMRSTMSAQHRRKGKSKRSKRNARLLVAVTPADSKTMQRMLPYGIN